MKETCGHSPHPYDETEFRRLNRLLMLCFRTKKHFRGQSRAANISRAARIAEKLLSENGNITDVMLLSVKKLMNYGLSHGEAVRLRLVTGVYIRLAIDRLGRVRLDDRETLAEYIRLHFMGFDEEILVIFPTDGTFIGKGRFAANGSIDSIKTSAAELFLLAKQCRGCTDFILAHNHPHAASTPSEEDIKATEYLNAYFHFHGKISLIAHYVYGIDGITKLDFDRNVARYYLMNGGFE